MKAKTEELLYLLLWSCSMLARPTFRNLTDSFETWAYRNGLGPQLAELERRDLLECLTINGSAPGSIQRVLRLTEAGRLHALAGRDPEACWRRPWDGQWRMVLFDLPVTQNVVRDRLRTHLRRRGFGCLQKSVWISPDALEEEKAALTGSKVDVGSLILLEGRPGAGETNEEIVAAAWDFAGINDLYTSYMEALAGRPKGLLRANTAAVNFRQWANQERLLWLEIMSKDPLLPERLWPKGYLGRKAWRARMKCLPQAGEQIRSFKAE